MAYGSKHRARRALAFAGLAAIAVFSFFSVYRYVQTRNARPVETLSICHTWTLAQLSGVAFAKGFFADEGLVVTFKPYPLASDAFDAMLDGKCDIATVTETPIVFKSFERSDFRIIATTHTDADYNQIIARTDRNISKPRDLRGKRIGVIRASSAHFFIYRFLLEYGLTTDDTILVYETDIDRLQRAFINGEVDAVAIWQPHTMQIASALKKRALIFSAPQLVPMTTNLLASERLIRNRPQVIPPFLKAQLRAISVTQRDPVAAANLFARVFRVSEAQARSVWFSTHELSLSQALLLSLEDKAQWAIKNGLVGQATLPNYLHFLYLEGLESVAPQAVTVWY